MKTIKLPTGEQLPALGQGTWRMGEDPALRKTEIAALQLGMDLGMTLIDTAEMYGEGSAEVLVGEALAGRREQAFIVTKVYPHNASLRGAVAACERSLKRLKTECIDLYLLHWRGPYPLSETMAAFELLQRDGKIRHYGVSNLDLADMQELWGVQGGSSVVTNQLLYNLNRRGIEWDLLPWQRRHDVITMAYSPIEQGRLVQHRKLQEFAQRHGLTSAQVALAWLLAQEGVVVIPKSGDIRRVRDNAGARDVALNPEQLGELDKFFPPPKAPSPLQML